MAGEDGGLEAPEQAQIGVQLAGALNFFWYGCGAVHEGRAWLERALLTTSGQSRNRLRALSGYSAILLVQGDHEAAQTQARLCLHQAEQLDEPLFVGRAMADLAGTLSMRDDLPGAQELLESALRQLRRADSSHPFVALAATGLAMVLLLRGDPAGAEVLCAKTREWCLARGERWWLGHTLTVSAAAAAAHGDPPNAIRFARASLQARQALNDPLGVAACLERLAWFAATNTDHVRAAHLLGAADRRWRDIGQVLYGAPAWRRSHEQCKLVAQRSLGRAQFASHFSRGAKLSPAGAIAYALAEATPPTGRDTPRDANMLTRREREVAELLGQGLNNKQIAARLMIAKSTAASHVEHILRKLGFTARAQVAAWVHGAAVKTEAAERLRG